MNTEQAITQAILIVIAVIAMTIVVRLRRRSYRRFTEEAGDQRVCEHLRPALQLLRERGHSVVRAGQKHPEMPLEIHLTPAFSPQAIYDELKLSEPVYVSDRNVLYCKEDWCELHPPHP